MVPLLSCFKHLKLNQIRKRKFASNKETPLLEQTLHIGQSCTADSLGDKKNLSYSFRNERNKWKSNQLMGKTKKTDAQDEETSTPIKGYFILD